MSGAEERGDGEARDVTTITPYRDGPLLVRGPVRLQDMHGGTIEVGRETIALCRCGKSRIKPFCDGTHKLSGFRAPSEADARDGG
jgi:CDGSH-type Zn-finger protein